MSAETRYDWRTVLIAAAIVKRETERVAREVLFIAAALAGLQVHDRGGPLLVHVFPSDVGSHACSVEASEPACTVSRIGEKPPRLWAPECTNPICVAARARALENAHEKATRKATIRAALAKAEEQSSLDQKRVSREDVIAHLLDNPWLSEERGAELLAAIEGFGPWRARYSESKALLNNSAANDAFLRVDRGLIATAAAYAHFHVRALRRGIDREDYVHEAMTAFLAPSPEAYADEQGHSIEEAIGRAGWRAEHRLRSLSRERPAPEEKEAA